MEESFSVSVIGHAAIDLQKAMGGGQKNTQNQNKETPQRPEAKKLEQQGLGSEYLPLGHKTATVARDSGCGGLQVSPVNAQATWQLRMRVWDSQHCLSPRSLCFRASGHQNWQYAMLSNETLG